MLLLTAASILQAQPYKDLHDFASTVTNHDGKNGPDGSAPYAGVTLDKAGNMYGTTQDGGADIATKPGMVWEITAEGQYLDLHDFGAGITNANGNFGPDGSGPRGGVALDSAGNMYGTAYGGGANGSGIVWEITATGQYLDLHDFGGTVTNANAKSGPDGSDPRSGVTFDSKGNLYGTTAFGGANYDADNYQGGGTVWEITRAGQYLDLHDFGGTVTNANGKSGPDGTGSYGGVAFDGSGNMFGTAYEGGANSGGIVWEITTGGQYLDLRDFGGYVTNTNENYGPDGANPECGATFDGAGNMFGTASGGGGDGGGIVWEITIKGQYLDFYDFYGQSDPAAGVTLDRAGNLYGTTIGGGTNQAGNIWEITALGQYLDLHDFGIGSDGYRPSGAVAFDGVGDLVGTAPDGGENNGGMVWKQAVPALTLSPSAVTGGASSAGTISVPVASSSAVTVSLVSSGAFAKVPSSLVIPANSTSVSFIVATSPVALASNAAITATFSGLIVSGVLTVEPVPATGIKIAPTTVVGGSTAKVGVYLGGAASPSGDDVALSSSSPDAVVPATLVVAPGGTEASTSFATKPVSANEIVTITATAGAGSVHATVTLTPAVLISFRLTTSSILGGTSEKAAVYLGSVAGPQGIAVGLSSGNTAVKVPSSVVVPAGTTAVNFPVTSSPVSLASAVTITATFGSATLHTTLTLTPAVVSKIGVSPASLTGGASTAFDIYINGAAGPSGNVVNLSTTSTDAIIPATVTIPAGKTGIIFTVTSKPVSSSENITLTATTGAISKTTILTVTPAYVELLSVSPSTIVGGKTTTISVTLYGLAGPSGIVVHLSSSSPDAKIPSTVTVPAGSRTASLTLATDSVSTSEKITLTAATASTSVQTTLTLTP